MSKNNKKNNKNDSIEIIPVGTDGRFRVPNQIQEFFKVTTLKLSIRNNKIILEQIDNENAS